MAKAIRFSNENGLAEQKRITDKKRVADRCAKLVQQTEFALHEASRVGDSPDVLDHLIVHFKFNVNHRE